MNSIVRENKNIADTTKNTPNEETARQIFLFGAVYAITEGKIHQAEIRKQMSLSIY